MIGVVSLFIIDKAPTIHGPASPGRPGSSGWCPCWWGSSFGKAEYATSHGSCCFIWSQDSIVWIHRTELETASSSAQAIAILALSIPGLESTRVITLRAQFAMMSSCIFLMCKTKSPRFPSGSHPVELCRACRPGPPQSHHMRLQSVLVLGAANAMPQDGGNQSEL